MYARSHQSSSQDARSRPELPAGRCRFILLNPEIRGHRCACVGFTLNHTHPSVACECGHLSCYHVKGAEPFPEWDQVERRLQLLEGTLDRDNQGSLGDTLGNTVTRVGHLEEQMEKSKEEIALEVRAIYQQISRTWELVDHMAKGHADLRHHVLRCQQQIGDLNGRAELLANRMMDGDDAAMDLEVRIERVERLNRSTGLGGVRHVGRPRSSSSLTHHTTNHKTGPWTVHVSLLPTKDQPFPFEKDTTAYKRCLSRGLHRMVAVQGSDSESFVRAVSNAFKDLIQGRPWMPIQARLCDAKRLQGLPMLRPLPAALVGDHYDLDFLGQHCAVCGSNGKPDSLYIAMESEKLSWHFLRRAPCFLEGLEESWHYDALLDPSSPSEVDDMDEGDRPCAGDILKPITTLKRSASEISRAPKVSSGSAGDVDETRVKIARTTCVPVPREVRRRVGTV